MSLTYTVEKVGTNDLLRISLPNNLQVYVRGWTTDIDILHEIFLGEVYDKGYYPQPGDVIFDVGAHIGLFTIKTASLIGTDGAIYAFEPVKNNFDLLEKNIALNNFTNVKPFLTALGDKLETKLLCLSKTNTGMHTLMKTKGEKILVPVITLDKIIEKLSIEKINLLKLDVEGYELRVLQGGKNFLKVCQNLVIETHEQVGGPSNSSIVKFLKLFGFKTKIAHYKYNDIIYGGG